MKFQKRLAGKFAAAALAVGLAQAMPVFAADMTAAPDEASEPTAVTAQTHKSFPVHFNPLVSPEVLGGLGGVAALLLLLGLQQKTRSSLIRAGVSAAFVTALANPTLTQEERQPLPTQVAIVVDKSASQSIDGRDAATAEMQAALAEKLSSLQGVDVRVIEVGTPQNGLAANGTNLYEALQKNLAHIPSSELGAVIILTDGQIDDDPKTLSALSTEQTPVHVLISGREQEHDRRIVLESAPAYGVLKEDATIKFRVVDDGTPSENADRILVTMTVDGQRPISKYVTPDTSIEMQAPINHGGANVIEIKTEEVPGELTDQNNRIITTVQGVRENLNILLVSGSPGNDTRMWRNLLKSDPAVNLMHYSILRPPAKDDDTPLKEMAVIAMPTRELFENKLDEFDLIIFDRYQNFNIMPPHYMHKVAEYIDKGGAMMVVAGSEFTTAQGLNMTMLAPSLPLRSANSITEQPYAPEVTEVGQRHPVTRGLRDEAQPEWGRWFRIINADIIENEGDVVMEGPDDKPLLILSHKAEGRVATLLSDNSWLWARGYEGGGPYAELMQRTAHWLLKEDGLEEEALRSRIEDGQLVVERQTLKDSVSTVRVTSGSGETQTLTLKQEQPGLWRASIPANEQGFYKIQQDDKVSYANAAPGTPVEFNGTLSTLEQLKPLATRTGGSIERMSAAAPNIELRQDGQPMKGKGWIGVKQSQADILTDTKRLSLLSGFLGLGIFAAFMAAAWHREGGGFSRKTRDTASPAKPKELKS